MTSFIRKLILLIGMLLLIFVAADLFFQLPRPQGYTMALDWIPVSEFKVPIQTTFAALCLILPFVYIYLGLIESRLQRGIIGKGSDGENICLSPEAIERTVVKDVRQSIKEVTKIKRCIALQGRRGAKIHLNVGVSDHASVPEIRSRIRQQVAATLNRLIGFDDSSEIKVKVTAISLSRKSASRKGGGGRTKRKKTRSDFSEKSHQSVTSKS